MTKLIVERLREVQTLVIETNHDEKLLQNDTHRPWPVKQRIQSRHGHLSNTAAAGVIEDLLPGKIERVVLGHSQPRLQHAGACFEHGAGVAREVRQERRRNLLRDTIRNQFPIPDRRDRVWRVSIDFRKRFLSKRGVVVSPCHAVATKADDCRGISDCAVTYLRPRLVRVMTKHVCA